MRVIEEWVKVSPDEFRLFYAIPGRGFAYTHGVMGFGPDEMGEAEALEEARYCTARRLWKERPYLRRE